MDDAKPRATERSEGGSKRSLPTRRAVLTEIVMVRISKGDLMAFEESALENDWTLSQTIRVLARRGLKNESARGVSVPLPEKNEQNLAARVPLPPNPTKEPTP